jgi:hypothetical protein
MKMMKHNKSFLDFKIKTRHHSNTCIRVTVTNTELCIYVPTAAVLIQTALQLREGHKIRKWHVSVALPCNFKVRPCLLIRPSAHSYQ